jgi:hypothetical protein
MADHGWDQERATAHLRELVQAGFIDRDDKTGLTRIRGWWGHNAVENPNAAKAIARAILSLPAKSPITKYAVDELESRLPEVTSDRAKDTLSEAISEARARSSRYRSETAAETVHEAPHELFCNPSINHSEPPSETVSEASQQQFRNMEMEMEMKPEQEPEQQLTAAARARILPEVPPTGFSEAIPRVLALLDNSPNMVNLSRLSAWLRDGADLELDILPTIAAVVARKRQTIPGWLPTRLDYFDGPVADAKAARLKPLPRGKPASSGRARDATPQRKLSVAERSALIAQWGLQRAGRAEIEAKVRAEGLSNAWSW